MAPTKDELEQENAELRERVAALEDEKSAGWDHTADALSAGGTRRDGRALVPTDDDGNRVLSEGERQELESRGVATSPFDGKPLNALDEGVEPINPDARRRAERDRTERREDAPADWPLSGPPPAAGGDVNAER
jgi:hypothetical protein